MRASWSTRPPGSEFQLDLGSSLFIRKDRQRAMACNLRMSSTVLLCPARCSRMRSSETSCPLRVPVHHRLRKLCAVFTHSSVPSVSVTCALLHALEPLPVCATCQARKKIPIGSREPIATDSYILLPLQTMPASASTQTASLTLRLEQGKDVVLTNGALDVPVVARARTSASAQTLSSAMCKN